MRAKINNFQCHVILSSSTRGVVEMATVSVLFEFQGMRKELNCEVIDICSRLEVELRDMGMEKAKVDICTVKDTAASEHYLVQRFCNKWNCYVNVDDKKQIKDGDRLSIIRNPVMSKVIILY